jgi:hypothetical protein
LAIKKAKANYHNGTDFDTFHYETQVKQVKTVDSNGNVTGDLEVELTGIKDSVSLVDTRVTETNEELSGFKTDVGTVTSLTTTSKTVVTAINEVNSNSVNNAQSIAVIEDELNMLDNKINTHNHDSVYFKKSGGLITGETAVSNNVSFAGKNNSGVSVNLAKVDASNNTVFGSTTEKAIIQASNGDLSVFDGTNSHKVFHQGNGGHGSGFNADMVDGIEGSSIARKDATNYFQNDQFIDNGKSMVIRATEGSSQAGSIYFRDGDNLQKGRILVSTNGDFNIYAGTINGHTFKSTGHLRSTYTHELDATSREVRTQFFQSGDAGIGLYMNTSGGFGMYDWDNSNSIFTVDRNSAMVQFANAIKVQGRRLYIQTGAPTVASIGDVWIDI